MNIPTLYTDKCVLRPMEITDAEWLYKLFKDPVVTERLEGIALFNESLSHSENFIRAFIENSKKGLGCLWAIITNGKPAGFVSIYDLGDNPFFSYALFPKFRHQGLFSGILNIIIAYKL